MFTINATDARELQKAGISPDEHMENAIRRCESAIKDQARKGLSHVEVAVFFLTEDQFKKLVYICEEAGFWYENAHMHNDKTHAITIYWNKE